MFNYTIQVWLMENTCLSLNVPYWYAGYAFQPTKLEGTLWGRAPDFGVFSGAIGTGGGGGGGGGWYCPGGNLRFWRGSVLKLAVSRVNDSSGCRSKSDSTEVCDKHPESTDHKAAYALCIYHYFKAKGQVLVALVKSQDWFQLESN